MKEITRTNIKGNIKITKLDNNELLLEIPNQITPGAKSILAQCLTQIGGIKALDTIKVVTALGETVEASISAYDYNISTNTISLKAIFGASSFNGTVNTLFLHSNSLNKGFAYKTGVSINKDNQSSLQVDWEITII